LGSDGGLTSVDAAGSCEAGRGETAGESEWGDNGGGEENGGRRPSSLSCGLQLMSAREEENDSEE